jgi:hypothetical protein
MTHPLQGALENRDGAWVLTMERDFTHPAVQHGGEGLRDRYAELLGV